MPWSHTKVVQACMFTHKPCCYVALLCCAVRYGHACPHASYSTALHFGCVDTGFHTIHAVMSLCNSDGSVFTYEPHCGSLACVHTKLSCLFKLGRMGICIPLQADPLHCPMWQSMGTHVHMRAELVHYAVITTTWFCVVTCELHCCAVTWAYATTTWHTYSHESCTDTL